MKNPGPEVYIVPQARAFLGQKGRVQAVACNAEPHS